MHTLAYAFTGSELWANVALVVEIMAVILALSFALTRKRKRSR
ncbi:MAG: hypothetical protein AAGL90_03375 [Pseudomonadota bacterium]